MTILNFGIHDTASVGIQDTTTSKVDRLLNGLFRQINGLILLITARKKLEGIPLRIPLDIIMKNWTWTCHITMKLIRFI